MSIKPATKYFARYSSHIQEDIERGWSSWNYGEGGLKCDADQIEEWKAAAIDGDMPLCISGFELWGKDIEDADIRELYPNYWVLVDDRFSGSLAGVALKAEKLEDAIAEIATTSFVGDGDNIDIESCKLVYSCNDNQYHIFEVE